MSDTRDKTCYDIKLLPALICAPECSALRLYRMLPTRLDTTSLKETYGFTPADLTNWHYTGNITDNVFSTESDVCQNVATTKQGKITKFVNQLRALSMSGGLFDEFGNEKWVHFELRCTEDAFGTPEYPEDLPRAEGGIPGPVWFSNPPTRGGSKPTFVPRAGGGKGDEGVNICAGYFIGRYLGRDKVQLYRVDKDGNLVAGPEVKAVFGV